MKVLFAIPLLVFSCIGSDCLGAAADSQEILHLLIHSHKLPLDAQMHPGCQKNLGRSVGEYFSLMLSHLPGENMAGKKLEIACAPYGATSVFKAPKKGATPQECTVKVLYADDSNQPKLMELLFRLTKNGRGIERKFISCRTQ